MKEKSKRGSVFINIIAIIGVIFILVGIIWLIIRNWRQMPNILKVMILIFSTLAAFILGVLLKQNEHEETGRALITLGALLYILSLFLIPQIYHLVTTAQGYVWILFLAWTSIFITAYLLYSPENLVLSMITFFLWVISQYFLHTLNFLTEGEVIFSVILIFLSMGVLLYGLSILHKSLKHKLANTYTFWAVFYLLLMFYILSFQGTLPIISDFSVRMGIFTIFLISFIIFCFLIFIVGTLLGISKKTTSIQEILGFLAILGVLFILTLSTKAGAGLTGDCNIKSCYGFKTSSLCNSVSATLNCEWITAEGRMEGSCQQISCYDYKNESGCNSAPPKLNCIWKDTSCASQNCYDYENKSGCNSAPPKLNCIWKDTYCTSQNCYDYENKSGCNSAPPKLNCIWKDTYCTEDSIYEKCKKYNNQKAKCLDESLCEWNPSDYGTLLGRKLPTILLGLWIIINFVFIGFIILVLWYGQLINYTKLINLGLLFFILEILTRYIGFWVDYREKYFVLSILFILGGIMLILGLIFIPKLRKSLLEKTRQNKMDD
ncbi:MAG: DUF2157 domain-containing protein [Candidatus Pacearchaeota archaeon]